MNRPRKIRSGHLERLAIVYVRQSSMEQATAKSAETQRCLADVAQKWGWPESRILVIEEDQGLSGTSSENRPGFRRMLGHLQRGEVGVVFVRDVTRLSRDPVDGKRFLRAAMRARILLYVNDRLQNIAMEFAALSGLFDGWQSRGRGR